MRKYNLIFFSVIFLIGTDTFLISPLLPKLSQLYHISPSISGWMVSAYAIGYAVFALIAGPFSDSRDRKLMLMTSLIGFTLSTFLCSFATSFPLMLLFRFLAGISASFGTPQIWAAIPEIAPKNQVVKMIGIASSGLALAQIAGVPIGSLLANFNWRAPFLAISLFSLLLLFIIIMFLPSLSSSRQGEKRNFIKTYGDLLHNKKALLYLLGYLLFQIGSFSVFIFIGTWFSHHFGLSLTEIATSMIIIGLGQFLGSFFGNRLIIKLGLAKSLSLGIIALLLIYSILPFAPAITFAVAGLFFVFIVNGFIYPVFMALIQSSTETARGTISSLANATMYLGTTLAGVAGGILFSTKLGFGAIIIFTIVFELLGLLTYLVSGIFQKNIL